MRAATTSTGCFADDPPGLQGLAHNLPLVLSFEPAAIPIGGTQAITDALVSAGTKRGVEYHTRTEVDRVLVHGDRATGIQLADGSQIGADVVVSALGIPQTVLRMLADAELSPRLAERINNIHYDRGQLWWANVAVHEPPQYAAETTNPGIGPQPRLYWGPEGPRLLRDALQGGDLPGGHGEADVRSHLVRHLLGSGPRTRGQAHHRRRGVRCAHPAVRQGAVA